MKQEAPFAGLGKMYFCRVEDKDKEPVPLGEPITIKPGMLTYKDDEPQLKYYAFENGGIVWDDDSEPDHDRIERLRVSEGRVMLASTMPSVSRLDRQVNAAPRHPLPHPHGRGQDVRLPRKTGTAGLSIPDKRGRLRVSEGNTMLASGLPSVSRLDRQVNGVSQGARI